MVGGSSGSTCLNDRHESLTPCRKITGTPVWLPRSAYCSVTPVGSAIEWTMVGATSSRVASLAFSSTRDDVSVMSARTHAFSNRARAAAAASALPCACRLSDSPNSDQPFSRTRARSSRYTVSASLARPAWSSSAPSTCRVG